MLQTAYASGREAMPQLREEAQQAKEQGAEDVGKLKDKLPDTPASDDDPPPTVGRSAPAPRPI